MQAKAIGVVANAGSGRNSREKEAVEHAMEVFGPTARLVYWDPETDRMADLIDELEGEGRDLIVAAGGDGTIMAVASEMRDRKAAMGVLPLGTFNFFARGLGLPQEPQEAAEAILAGRAEKMSLATVNGQVFLNNASLGIYPSILKQREDVYERWGDTGCWLTGRSSRPFWAFSGPCDCPFSRMGSGGTSVRRCCSSPAPLIR